MKEEWKQLVDGCLAARRPSQMAFYRRYAPMLYPACRRILVSNEEAEEVLQDSFLKILTHLTVFDHEAQLMAWMKRVVVRTAIDTLRRTPFEWDEINEQVLAGNEEETVDESIILHRVEQVKRAVERLPAGYRTVLSLHLFEGYDLEEIAQILHLKPSSARSQYMRAKTKLLTLISTP